MEAADEDTSPTKTPAPITALIASRVKELRTEARLSGPALAAKLNKLGVPWNRTTIAKFETGHRHSISVQELLALALALGVPPMLLMGDPRHVNSVPLAEGVEINAWGALIWQLGRGQLTPDGDSGDQAQKANFSDSAQLIGDTWTIIDGWLALHPHKWAPGGDGPSPEQQAEILRTDAARYREVLIGMRIAMDRLVEQGAPLPPLPDYVWDRAEELGIKFPSRPAH